MSDSNFTSTIDKKIKKTFRLFIGLRETVEDQKIYDKVYDLCFQETIKFIEDNLDISRKSFLLAELEKLEKQNCEGTERKTQEALEIIFKYLTAVPHYRFRLNKRLEYFIDNLLYSSLKKKQNL